MLATGLFAFSLETPSTCILIRENGIDGYVQGVGSNVCCDTAGAGDYGSNYVAYYFDGGNVKHSLAISGGSVTLPAGVTGFYVAVQTTQDNVYVADAQNGVLRKVVANASLSSGAVTTIVGVAGKVRFGHVARLPLAHAALAGN